MAVFVGFTIQFLTFIFDAVTFLFLPWQPDQDFGGEKGLLHHTHTWILFRLLRRGTSLQILFWKIQILTIFIYAKRWMGLLRSTLQLLRQKHSCITNNKERIGGRLKWSPLDSGIEVEDASSVNCLSSNHHNPIVTAVAHVCKIRLPIILKHRLNFYRFFFLTRYFWVLIADLADYWLRQIMIGSICISWLSWIKRIVRPNKMKWSG